MHLGDTSKEDKVPNGDDSLLVEHIELLRYSCHEEAAAEDGLPVLVLVTRLGWDGSLSIISTSRPAEVITRPSYGRTREGGCEQAGGRR